MVGNCKVELKELYPVEGGTLHCLWMKTPWDAFDGNWKRPAVIVVPGGAYAFCSRREGMPIASEFFAKGYQVFVLEYLTCNDDVRYPEQLIELGSAVDYVKKNADEFFVNPDEVFVIGFSAGGHLVGNLAVEYQDVSKKAGVELNCEPKAVGLCYPVISQKTAYKGSHENLLNGYTDEAKVELLKTLNLDEAVSEKTPPAFIWSTKEDTLVPSENALLFALAMARNNRPYELHVYPTGTHGLSTGSREVNSPDAKTERLLGWIDSCIKFFRSYCVEPF